MSQFSDLLIGKFAPYGALSAVQVSQLERHYELLLKWNKTLNLTRITDISDSVELHYCESLYLAEFLPKLPLRIADVGSGAGFPGIPVAIYRPNCVVDLIESHQRKAVFLGEAVRELKLTNVTVRPVRAEDARSEYDWVVSRAVNPRGVLDLTLAPNIAILGSQGDKLPWGQHRGLFHVKR